MGLFGVNSSKSESQFFKIENILKFSKISEIKLKPLRKIEYDSNFSEFNKLIKNKKDVSDKYFFVTNNGRWTGFIDDNILKTVSLKKWERNFVGDFKKPIDSFENVNSNDKLWKTIEKIEETSEGFLLVLNAANIPLGIIDRSKIGNFVEIKKSTVGKKSKVNHLSYIGDSDLGKSVNIGAGTITCNYDGVKKSKTKIKDKVFVGSNSSLVAPITIEQESIIGAGSVITKTVKKKSLALTRSLQTEIKNYKRK